MTSYCQIVVRTSINLIRTIFRTFTQELAEGNLTDKMTALARQSSLQSLRLRWKITALGSVLFLGAGYGVLAFAWQAGYATRWLIQASCVMIYVLWVLRRSLEYNVRTHESTLLAEFGAGNTATILRGGLIAALAGFLFLPWPQGSLAWAPGVLFTAAVISDFMDGYLARVTKHATRMGEILDMSFDGLGVFVAALLAVQYGQVPAWYLVVALARYLFLGGILLRRRRGLPVYELPPSIRRRAFAGVQMGFLFFILWPIFSPPSTYVAAVVFAAPFLIGFLIDWLITSGHLKGRVSNQPLVEKSWVKTALNWLPAGLRSITAALITGQVFTWLRESPSMVGIGAKSEISSAVTVALVIGLAQAAVMVFLFLGAGGRITAIIGLFLLGIQQMSAGLTALHISLIILYTAILYLGTGPLSIWKPEDRWIYRRAGE